MKKIISSLTIGSLVLAAGLSASTSATAATLPTLVISGGSATFG